MIHDHNIHENNKGLDIKLSNSKAIRMIAIIKLRTDVTFN